MGRRRSAGRIRGATHRLSRGDARDRRRASRRLSKALGCTFTFVDYVDAIPADRLAPGVTREMVARMWNRERGRRRVMRAVRRMIRRRGFGGGRRRVGVRRAVRSRGPPDDDVDDHPVCTRGAESLQVASLGGRDGAGIPVAVGMAL
jgi:hypothetical protein